MDTLGSRLKNAMDAKGVKPADMVARKVLSKAGIYQWLNHTVKRDKVRDETVKKVCTSLGIRREWLLDGIGAMRPEAYEDRPEPLDDGHSSILGYAQAVGLGDGVEAEEYAETHKLKFRADSLARKRLKPRDLAVFYGKGDSMEPRIHEGDAVLFDQSDTRPRDGHLYVILVPGAGAETYSVKRCELIEDMVLFKSDNPKGDHGWTKPRRMDDPRKPIKIIGRVRWIGSWEG
jgi:phage repressor protein C with HTH and peptisase S24 domain